MTLEATLERIAVALEAIAAGGGAIEAAPKASRKSGKKSSAESGETKPADSPSESAPESSETTAKASTPETASAPSETIKKVVVTKEQARAALVEVQTVLGHKDHAMLIVQQFSKDGFNSIPPEQYGALVAAAKAKIAEFNASK